jgi:inhibitor of KinA sporulation pathway (predicted exonuclease)
MHYIVMDLEWNNTYAKKTRGFINEVIEIGAVMLDEDLNNIGEFSSLVRSQIGKKLRGNVKKLTNITNSDVRSGELFTKVMSDFKSWINGRENVILTWGDGDIRVLIENFKYLNGIDTIPFLSNYTDIQQYFQIREGLPRARQIGLSTAAELVGINDENFSHHRALDDSLITAECMKKIFDKEDFSKYILKCDEKFYQKLAYKPHAIGNVNSPLVDKNLLDYTCENCGTHGVLIGGWRYSNQYFRAVYHCPKCNNNVRVAVRFKKYFDRLETRKSVSVITDEKENNVSEQAD